MFKFLRDKMITILPDTSSLFDYYWIDLQKIKQHWDNDQEFTFCNQYNIEAYEWIIKHDDKKFEIICLNVPENIQVTFLDRALAAEFKLRFL